MRKTYTSEPVEYPTAKRFYGNGDSPWQKLVEDRRVQTGLTLRDVANAVTKSGSKLTFNTLWLWLRHRDGFPNPRSYTATMNTRLARALKLPATQLAAAYEESRRAVGLPETVVGEKQSGKLAMLRHLIELDTKKTYTRDQILALISTLE